jgi:hypothetical protein
MRPGQRFQENLETDLALNGSIYCMRDFRAHIFKLSRSAGIDFKELIPPAYVAWRAGTITLFLLGS